MKRKIINILLGLLIGLISFLLSKNPLTDEMSPFGIAFASAFPQQFMPLSLIGSIIGYIGTPDSNIIPLRYVATILMFTVIFGALKNSKIECTSIKTAGIVGISCILTGFTMLISSRGEFSDYLWIIIEAGLAFGASIFFNDTFNIKGGIKNIYSLNGRESSALIVAMAVLAICLSKVEVYHINFALLIFSYILIAITAYSDSFLGCFIGIILSLSLALGTGSYYLLVAIILSTLLQSIFIPGGQVISTFGIMLGALIPIPVGEEHGQNMFYAAHILLAALFFLITPNILTLKIKKILQRNSGRVETEQKSLLWIERKLSGISDAFMDVSNVLSKILSTTEHIFPEDANGVQLRNMVSQQITEMSEILNSICNKIRVEYKIDYDSTEKIENLLRQIDFQFDTVSCFYDERGLTFIDIVCQNTPEQDYAFMLSEKISILLDKEFEFPEHVEHKTGTMIKLREIPEYKICVGSHQIQNSSGCKSGDYFTSFLTDAGKYIMLLSDGMGTGPGAAIGSALSIKVLENMLRENLDFDCALKLANTVVMINSGDESLATVDIACIDIYTGQADFYKAGAAATLVRHDGEVRKLDKITLPIGILNEAEYSHSTATLNEGDIILMSSDGIWVGDELRIARQLSYFRGNSMTTLAEKIAKAASGDPYSTDDITVLAARIECR
ncbi:MAG: SpoIIE family protein phosphatase [Oscillospiraceae bacterium]|nr:SpoIIE family protein phosphatase [Oscillospiraceae bacterium]